MTVSARNSLVLVGIAVVIAIATRGQCHAQDDSNKRKKTDDKFAKQFEQARVHLQKGRTAEALEAYLQLREASADTVRVAIGISRVHEAEGRLGKAAQELHSVLDESPNNANLLARVGEAAFRRGKYEEARKHCDASMKIDPDEPRARLVRAHLFAESGQLKKADDAYRWLVRYYNRAQPEDAETLLLVAEGAAQYARWHSVSAIFNFVVNTLCPDALKNDEHSWQAYHLSGLLLLEKYNRAQAIPEFHHALSINPRATEVLVALGRAALQRREVDEASEFAERALAINASSVSALQLKTDLQLFDGQFGAARKLLERAMQVNPNDQGTLARLAACHLLQDGMPSKEKLSDLISNLDAIEQVKIGEKTPFTSLVFQLAKRNPHPGEFLTVLASVLESRRKFFTAEMMYRNAIKTMPQLPDPKTALGMLYMQMGKTDQARKLLDDAFKADPFHVRVSNMRKVLKVLDSYDAIETEHFTIRVNAEEDKILGRYMAEYLEEQYGDLVKHFGFEPPGRTQFEIYHDAKGLSAHQWFSARMVGLPWIQTIGASTGMIVAMASPTASERPYNWARVVKHEFVHIITLQQTGFNIPHWFTEALAVTSEGYPRPALWDKLLAERVPKGDLMNLDNINLGFIRPKSPMDWQFAYCQSLLYAQFIEEQFGEKTIAKLLQAYRKNLNTADAIQRACGVDKQTFEAGYRKYLDRVVAEIKTAQSEPDESLDQLEKDYTADPENSEAAAKYADGLLRAKQRGKARKLALSVLEKNKNEPLAATVMASLELRAEDSDSAAEFLETALDRENPHPRVLELLARIRFLQDRFDESAELYELGREKFPRSTDWLKGLAAAYLESGSDDKLKNVLIELARHDADNFTIRKKLAEMTFKKRQFKEARDHARSALYIDVLDADIHRILATANAELGKYERAIREFEVGLQLDPQDIEMQYGLANAFAKSNKKTEARDILAKLLRQEPDHDDAKKLLKQLD